jgi:hypothetical protein
MLPRRAFRFGDFDAATAGASLDLASVGHALPLRQARHGPLVESSLTISASARHDLSCGASGAAQGNAPVTVL